MKLKHLAVAVQIASLIVMSAMYYVLIDMSNDIHRLTTAMFEENPFYNGEEIEAPYNR